MQTLVLGGRATGIFIGWQSTPHAGHNQFDAADRRRHWPEAATGSPLLSVKGPQDRPKVASAPRTPQYLP